ncbi:CGNR zinc finger domain-containing protein [Paenactinomyces guangxiensis]|uniref:CGNR zinc finger domain-containing protein n=1 Tax=Paenactinomyces guangxiensis TaxID=1490290 RepID=A0A7W1WQ84_9BACL|nr:CGNR zinc finger domain-containing protein [Paenactinomyces guangxiensis]MBA4493919.1 CGNR zinc finger domain-containing protein [Paenactinomyces guangxiensis]MBH8591385.1 CGNR zinc finger domain-containing protein [Paenactinomyces guangxiensis]
MEVLCFDFLNSDWRDWRGSGRREDRLLNEEWLKSFLEKWDLAADPVLEEDTYQVLVRLRARLQKMVEALVNHQSLSPTDITFLNEWLQQTSYHLQLVGHLDKFKLEQVAAATGWTLVMGQIVRSFAELLAHNDVRRIKICINKDCRWVFYDESRNRSRQWCDPRMCGNLLKVRRFRERKKGTKGRAR